MRSKDFRRSSSKLRFLDGSRLILGLTPGLLLHLNLLKHSSRLLGLKSLLRLGRLLLGLVLGREGVLEVSHVPERRHLVVREHGLHLAACLHVLTGSLELTHSAIRLTVHALRRVRLRLRHPVVALHLHVWLVESLELLPISLLELGVASEERLLLLGEAVRHAVVTLSLAWVALGSWLLTLLSGDEGLR